MKQTQLLIVRQVLAGTLLSHELNKLNIDHQAGVRPTIKDQRPVLGFS